MKKIIQEHLNSLEIGIGFALLEPKLPLSSSPSLSFSVVVVFLVYLGRTILFPITGIKGFLVDFFFSFSPDSSLLSLDSSLDSSLLPPSSSVSFSVEIK